MRFLVAFSDGLDAAITTLIEFAKSTPVKAYST